MDFRRVAFAASADSPWYVELYRSVSGVSARSFSQNGPLYAALLILIVYGWRKHLVMYCAIPFFLYVWYRYGLYQSWYFLYAFPLIIMVGLYAFRQFEKRSRFVLVTIFIFLAFVGLKFQLHAFSWAYDFWIGRSHIYEKYYIDGPNLKDVTDYLNTTFVAKEPDYKMYAINFWATVFVDDAFDHLIPDPSHEGLSYVYNHVRGIEETKKFLIRKGIRYVLISYPSYAQRLHEIEKYAHVPYVSRDIRMIDELIRSSAFEYSNDTFFILDLTRPSETT